MLLTYKFYGSGKMAFQVLRPVIRYWYLHVLNTTQIFENIGQVRRHIQYILKKEISYNVSFFLVYMYGRNHEIKSLR